MYLPVTGKHHKCKRVLKLLVIRSADRDLCIIRKYNALMTVSTYSMKINGKAVMTETEIRFHSFGKNCQFFFCCIFMAGSPAARFTRQSYRTASSARNRPELPRR